MNKIFLSRLFVSTLGIFCLLAWTNPVSDMDMSSHLDEQEEIIRGRIPSVVTIVNPIYNPAVRSYLNTYINRRPDHTACMLGWASVYFPMFEKALAEEGLPTDLKYLSIVESALNPNAISRSGAGGLWQFMKPTARECGLKISSYVDERMDPQKSTKAAVRYLKQLYTMFGDWELVMAAYNAGPGRVRSAVKRAGSNNYWVMARYLPAETQSYVPGFIAASYLMNFHSAHNIMPIYPELAMNDLITVYVYEGMSITDAARRSGLTVDDLKRLNPTFVRNYIPASPSGYSLMLPYKSAELFNSGRSMEAPGMADNSFAKSATVTIDGQTFTITTTSKDYVVRSGDNLYTIAQRNRCSVREIMTWNGLHDSRLAIGQRLELRFVTKELLPAIVEAVLSPVGSRTNQKVNAMACLSLECLPIFRAQNITFAIDPVVKDQGSNILILQRRQSVRQAVHQYHLTSNVTAKAFDISSNIIPGDIVKVR